MRIIVVEDEVKPREGIVRMISDVSQEYHVIAQADNGLEGLEYIKRLKPDLIISDIRMPKLNGLDMVYQLQKLGIYIKTIIVTGYAEFEYAKRGINLGIEDYLLKPITYNDMKNVLLKIKNKLETETRQKADILFDKYVQDRIFESLLLGEVLNDVEIQMFAQSILFNNDRGIALSFMYTGDIDPIISRMALNMTSGFLEDIEDLRYSVAYLKARNGIALITSSGGSSLSLLECIKYNLIPLLQELINGEVIFSWSRVFDLKIIDQQLEDMTKNLKWALALGSNETITKDRLEAITVKELCYPHDIEISLLSCLRNYDMVGFRENMDKFIEYYKAEEYSPIQIIDMCYRLTFVILNLIKDINYDMFKHINKKDILQSIKNAAIRSELDGCLYSLVRGIEDFLMQKKNEQAYSLLVRKVLNIIERDYYGKLQLGEIAKQLNVTMEYLSYLFTKETGEAFSIYLKKYRIQKAKELLLDPNMKIYEIAEKVGYSDVKYFCRIFKEVTGFPTGEYIKLYHK